MITCKNAKFFFPTIFIFFFSFYLNAQQFSFAQAYFKPSIRQGKISEFLEDINAHSVFIIEYSSFFFDTAKIIHLEGNEKKLGIILQKVLANQKVSIVERNKKIILRPSLDELPYNSFFASYSIFGVIKEKNTKEPLSGATITDIDNNKVILSNNEGYFTFFLKEGRHTFNVSYIGLKTLTFQVNLIDNQRIDVELPQTPVSSPSIIVSTLENLKKDGANKVIIDSFKIAYSNLLGEDDPLRLLYQFSGINSLPESNSSFLIRGGSPDQNVFLLDGNLIFNPSHVLGSLSIINNTSLKSLRLFKSDFPAIYEGGLSSIIDVSTKDGNMKNWKGEINTSFLAGSFSIEGPLKKEKTAIMLSIRKSWINPFLGLIHKDYNADFYDINYKITHILSSNDKILFGFYMGKDFINQKLDNTNNKQLWGNQSYSFTWNHILGSKAFLNSTINFTSYKNSAGYKLALFDSSGSIVKNNVYNNYSSIKQFNLKSIIDYSINNYFKFKGGVKIASTFIKPYRTNISEEFVNNFENFRSFSELKSSTINLFGETEFTLNKKILFRPGLNVLLYSYNNYRFISPQLRLFTAFRIRKNQQITFSASQMVQHLHLLINPTLGVNADVWVPSTSLLQPEKSNQINLGYTFNKKSRGILLETEIYYKQFIHVTNYAEGKNIFFNTPNWETSIESGKGSAYGLESRIKQLTSHYMFNITYALAWNWRQFSNLNNGYKFPYKYDRRHTVSAALSYFLNKKINISALWNFSSGDMINLPEKLYPNFNSAQQIQNNAIPGEYMIIYHFSGKNIYRSLPYNNIDFSTSYTHSISKNIMGRATFGIYNLSGSPSQYIYNLEGFIGSNTIIAINKYKVFNLTPYLSYTINFN